MQVVLAAIFDLLFFQCDRHSQNLYLLPNGSIRLIKS
jgi:predicted unusual protein kinase regulating ubiquinone biosynthesis (AarF/ABC1/UbiB family)